MDVEGDRFETRFRAAIADDLDLPSAMALIAELARSDVPPRARASLLRSWDSVLGLDLDRAQPAISLPDGASTLLESRERARAAKDFVTSDHLRNELAALGVAVTDTPDGQRWRVSGRTATHI
jgi:cysteinyl-tRNA synthetase